jgi:DNA-binding transcriptional regulator LsrR (DeoR family)
VPEDLRRNNLAALVRHLHLSGPLTRSQLTARTGLNRSTVGDLVGELASVGLVSESVPLSRAGAGRPSLVVSLDAERVWVLAVELAA